MFKEKYSKFFEKIGRSKFMVLSTSKDDFVTSRMVSIIVIDGKFYFQTDKNFKKYNQIIVNPNVSLCIDNVLIIFRLMGYVVMSGDLSKIKHFVKYLKKNIQVHTKIIHF